MGPGSRFGCRDDIAGCRNRAFEQAVDTNVHLPLHHALASVRPTAHSAKA
jgi:hypothetical protein